MSENIPEIPPEVRKQVVLERTPLLAKFLDPSREPDPKWEDTFEKQARDLQHVFVDNFRDVWLEGVDTNRLLDHLYKDQKFRATANEDSAMKMRMMGDYIAAIGYSIGTNAEEHTLFLHDICTRIEERMYVSFDQDPKGPLHGYVATYLDFGRRLRELRESQKRTGPFSPEELPDSIKQFLDSLDWDDNSEE